MLLGLSSIIYCSFWFQAFFDHDYYMMTPLIFPVMLLITCCENLNRTIVLKFSAPFIFLSFSLLAYLFYNNYYLQSFRYSNISRYPNLKSPILTIEPYLREIGISRTDKVVSVPDGIPSITLYLMNDPGWTEFGNYDQYNIHQFIKMGAQYLIIADSSYLHNNLYMPFLKNKIGYYTGVSIFKL